MGALNYCSLFIGRSKLSDFVYRLIGRSKLLEFV